ncbi:MAG: PfkB family carbohydrate kinase, partial [Saprospiraceae bacterium]
MKKVFVSGNFNILHPGHLRLFRFARELGERLIVGVYSDRIAGRGILVPEQLRLEALQSNSWIDEVLLVDRPLEEVIRELRPAIVVKGKEHEALFNIERAILEEYGGKLVFSSGEAVFSAFDLIRGEFDRQQALFRLPADYMARHDLGPVQMAGRIQQFRALRVLVAGDLIVDEYITCESLGMSQEDPTIVVTPIASKTFIGGAGIVAAHAASLGAKVDFLSVSGTDAPRDYAAQKFGEFSVQAHLLEDESRPTTLKQRYRCKGKTLLRVSHLHQGAISGQLQRQMLERAENLLEACDLLIFADFNYGCLPTELVRAIAQRAAGKGVLMVADSQSSSQSGDIARFRGMELITPTEREARLSMRDNESGLIVLAEALRQQAEARNVFLKIGEEGVIIHAD